MDKQLLRKVLARIEEDYTHFNMGWWYNKITKGMKAKNPQDFEHLACGTVGCFAGHVIIETLGNVALAKMNEINSSLVPNTARELLCFTEEDQDQLFYMSSRRPHYVPLMGLKPGTKAYAKGVVKAIRQYILEKHGEVV